MTRLRFKKHRIARTCTKKYIDYHSYKSSLQKDFGGHCAYCNLNEEWVDPLPFEVEHFIPRTILKAQGRKDLDTDYRNLMLSCPRCNKLKGNRFVIILWRRTIIQFFIGMEKEESILMMSWDNR